MAQIEAGAKLPDLSMLKADAAGAAVDLNQEIGDGPVLLGIYKSSCQASKTTFPILERLHLAFRDSGLNVIGVSQDSPNVTQSFARRTGVTFPLLVEPEGWPASIALDIFATPTIILAARGGKVLFATAGFLRDQIQQLADLISATLGTAPVKVFLETDTDVPLFVPG